MDFMSGSLIAFALHISLTQIVSSRSKMNAEFDIPNVFIWPCILRFDKGDWRVYSAPFKNEQTGEEILALQLEIPVVVVNKNLDGTPLLVTGNVGEFLVQYKVTGMFDIMRKLDRKVWKTVK